MGVEFWFRGWGGFGDRWGGVLVKVFQAGYGRVWRQGGVGFGHMDARTVWEGLGKRRGGFWGHGRKDGMGGFGEKEGRVLGKGKQVGFGGGWVKRKEVVGGMEAQMGGGGVWRQE